MFKEGGQLDSLEREEVDFSTTKLSEVSREIHENALLRAKKYLVAEAELLDAIMQVDRDETYRKLGEAFLTPYCEKYLGLSHEVAANFVRVARKSQEIPALQKAVKEGLSITKAKAIVSVLTEANHQDWIEKAQTLTKGKLEKEVAKTSPSPSKPEKAKPTGENRTRLEFELSDEDMALQKRATDLLCAKLGRPPTLNQVQRALLEEFLKHHDPVKKAQRAHSRKDRSRERLRGQAENKKQAIPAAVKHEVNQRDQGQCQAKLPDGTHCRGTRWVELHHVIPRARGGTDNPKNLVTLCSAHHRMWHRRHAGWRI